MESVQAAADSVIESRVIKRRQKERQKLLHEMKTHEELKDISEARALRAEFIPLVKTPVGPASWHARRSCDDDTGVTKGI